MIEAKIKAIAPWFGGKRTMAPAIVRELGKHTAYWEPFCGGLSVIFAKSVSRQECVNDLHGDVINLARVVASDEHAPILHDRLTRTLAHEEELAAARAQTVELPEPAGDVIDVDRAHAFFVVSWLGRSGESGLGKRERASRICVRWTANGGDPATRFRNAIESIPAWWQRLRQVTILRRDAFELIDKISDDPGVAIYLDPPYLKKSDDYLHDFQEASPLFSSRGDDHQRLAESLSRFRRARVVVSYYDHPRLDELYSPGKWQRVAFDVAKNLSRQGNGAARARELLIINGPSYASETC